MLNKFKNIPAPLQKQILIRFGCGILFLLLDIVGIITIKDLSAFFVGLIVMVFCLAQALWLFYLTDNKKYVVISGMCCDMVVTPIKRRIKSILMSTIVDGTEIIVRVIVRGRMKKFLPGTQLDVYVAEKTLMHERDGAQQLHGYLAIDLKGGRKNESDR